MTVEGTESQVECTGSQRQASPVRLDDGRAHRQPVPTARGHPRLWTWTTPRYRPAVPPREAVDSMVDDAVLSRDTCFAAARPGGQRACLLQVPHAGVLLALWAVCSVQPAAGACEPLDLADAAIEIVPTECSFWKQAGIVRRKGSNADAKTAIKWNRDCGVPIGYKEIRFSAPGEGRMGVEDSIEEKGEPIAVRCGFVSVCMYVVSLSGCVSVYPSVPVNLFCCLPSI